MIELEQYAQDLQGIRKSILSAGEALHVDHMREQVEELEQEMNQPDFWNDLEHSTKVNQKVGGLKNRIAHYEKLLTSADDIEVMMDLAKEENDEDMVREAGEAIAHLKEQADALELETLMRGNYDDSNAVLSLHAGAGGTEAQDWTQMLYRMYTRYCERMGFTIKLLDYLEGDDIRSLLSYADRGGRVFCIGTQLVDDNRFILLPEPDSNHYLEWYTDVQRRYNLPHAVAIENPDRYLLQNHYRNDQGDDIFLFVNAQLHGAISSSITFPKEIYQNRTAWVYNAATDEKQLLTLENASAWLYLPPAESLFIIFEKHDAQAADHASLWSPAYREGQHYFPIHTRWHVSLHHAIEGWTRDTVMQRLCDLRQTQFKDFAGTVTYTTHLPYDSLGSDPIFDFGEVYDICELIVNGESCGVKWYGERIYDNVAPHLHPGDNTIVIKVTTTLNNYVHTLTDDKVIQHYIFKRNVPTTPAGLVGQIAFF